jgi:hypothetical protein
MLSKTSQGFFKKAMVQANMATVHQAPARNFSGGGVKKPNMPASETDFDIVLVGKLTKIV